MFLRTMMSVMCFFNVTACGNPNATGQPNTIDPAFQPLYDQFINNANDAGLNLSSNQGIIIAFSTLGQKGALGEVIGECSKIGNGNGVIVIDSSYWTYLANPTNQAMLLWHELGHCVLGEQHVSDQENIMNPLIDNPLKYVNTSLDDMISKLYKQYDNSVTGVGEN